ncbi:MAG: hypothetical protein GEV11_00060 [Streptosporangiales bacterium]|nr:hypothetical protein [Streptosporangiales bacterium]
MPDVVDRRNGASRFSLKADGRSHPLENALALATFAVGMVAIVTGLITVTHVIGAWAGLAGVGMGLYSQMISATTAQRFFTVIGLTAAFVGMGMSVAHGGFVP